MEAAGKKSIIKNKLKNIWEFIWSNKLYPFFGLLMIYSIVFVIVFIYAETSGGFLHMNSDDLIQYYPYVSGFFDKIKSGQLSLYDQGLFGGVSFFSGCYYIPIDIFTSIAFLLSFVMQNETAYAIMNFMRPVCGALLLYYVLARRFNLKAAFLCSLILFCGGTTETYYIFPVYLGICFYAPLAMLIIDLCIEKKNYYYLLLPIYSFIVILYDFYIAYMLLAFACVYFVSTLFASLGNFDGSFRLRLKEFVIRFFEFMSLLLLGVVIGAFFLMPSALYITNQTSRNEISFKDVFASLFHYDNTKESYWYFNNEHGTIVNFSWRHYFTQWCNLFIPNDPHQLCLVEAGDYIREHATMYITCGGFIYLIYFFFLDGKYEARLKFFVLLMNILLCIPIFCVIFGFNTVPYLRWLFIPYFLNLYAACIAMDKNNLGLGKSKLAKYFGLGFMTIGLMTMVYVLMVSPDVFIHYKNTSTYFYLLLIPSIIAIALYVIVLLLSITFKMLDKDFLHGKAVPILIFAEFIFASIIIFANVDNTNARYYAAKSTNEERLETCKELYNYDSTSGYRFNLYTIFGRETTNLNIMEGNVNIGRFFQSFYNTPLNQALSKFYEESSTSWSRSFNGAYSLLSGPIFNTKYIITNENISLPLEYYNYQEKNNTKYYELKADIPFIVYDSCITSNDSLNAFTKQLALLECGYSPDTDTLNRLEIEIKEPASIQIRHQKDYSVNYLFYEQETDTNYYVYNLSKLLPKYKDYDAFMIQPTSEIRRLQHGFMYLCNEIPEGSDYTNLTQLHYNHYYNSDLASYTYLLVEKGDKDPLDSAKIYGYSKSLYNDFVVRQDAYTNKEFVLDGTKMEIKVTMPDDSKTRIIKTGYTYSKEWVLEKAYTSSFEEIKYETIDIDGGFLGIVVPKGVKECNVKLNFTPEGYSTGCKISIIGSIIYASILIPTIIVIVLKKKKRVIE